MAGARATLTGLIFVAVSINLSLVLTLPGLSGQAADSIMQWFGVLLISNKRTHSEQDSTRDRDLRSELRSIARPEHNSSFDI
jgi:hypothetical protein